MTFSPIMLYSEQILRALLPCAKPTVSLSQDPGERCGNAHGATLNENFAIFPFLLSKSKVNGVCFRFAFRTFLSIQQCWLFDFTTDTRKERTVRGAKRKKEGRMRISKGSRGHQIVYLYMYVQGHFGSERLGSRQDNRGSRQQLLIEYAKLTRDVQLIGRLETGKTKKVPKRGEIWYSSEVTGSWHCKMLKTGGFRLKDQENWRKFTWL